MTETNTTPESNLDTTTTEDEEEILDSIDSMTDDDSSNDEYAGFAHLSAQPSDGEDDSEDEEEEEERPRLTRAQMTMAVNDITHPAVGAIAATATARGKLPIDEVHEALKDAGIPKELHPTGVSQNKALRRSMVSLAKGASERSVKTTGRHRAPIYSILVTDLDRIEDDGDAGKGVSDVEVKAWIEHSGTSYTVKISPPNHPAAQSIRDRYDAECNMYSATYDLKVWLTQKLLPSLGGLPAPDASGKYIVPKQGNALKTLQAVQEAFSKVNRPNNKLRVYLTGVVAGDENAVDILADALADERDRVLGALRKELDAVVAGDKRIGKRRLASMTQEAHELRELLQRMSTSFSLSANESTEDIEQIEAEIAICETALDS